MHSWTTKGKTTIQSSYVKQRSVSEAAAERGRTGRLLVVVLLYYIKTTPSTAPHSDDCCWSDGRDAKNEWVWQGLLVQQVCPGIRVSLPEIIGGPECCRVIIVGRVWCVTVCVCVWACEWACLSVRMSVSISLHACGVPVCCLPVLLTGNKSVMAKAGLHVSLDCWVLRMTLIFIYLHFCCVFMLSSIECMWFEWKWPLTTIVIVAILSLGYFVPRSNFSGKLCR